MKIKHNKPLNYIVMSIVGITMLSGILLSSNDLSSLSNLLFVGVGSTNGSNNASATTLNRTTSTNATVKVNTFCSMTARTNPGEEHTIIMVGGQYQDEIGITTMQTFCNDPNGYAIYAIGYTGGDAGVAKGYNTVLRSNTLGPAYDIITGTSTNGLDNDDTSNWAMKLTAVDGAYKPDILSDDNGSFSDYHVVPSTYTKVASYPTATDLDNPASTRLGSNLTTTYAAYISNAQFTGTYEGQVKYVLVNPSTMDTPYYMQNVDEWGDTIVIGQEITAYDERDNKAYTVRRMCMSGTSGDSGCTLANSMLWMTQNLDLDLNKNIELTSEDTDLRVVDSKAYSAGYSQDALGIIHWTPKNSTITSINTSTGKFNSWANNNNVAYSADPDAGNPDNPWYATGEAYNSDLCYVGSNSSQTCNYLNANNTVAPTYFSHTAFTTNGNHGKIGNYYNWSAAIASNNSSGYKTSTQGNVANNPQNSICPKGWRLPTISGVATNNEFARLNTVYNGSTSNGTGLINSPVYMVRSGYVNDGSLYGAGYNGLYWSSTVYDASYAFYLNIRSDYVYPANYSSYRYFGRSVRCVSDY